MKRNWALAIVALVAGFTVAVAACVVIATDTTRYSRILDELVFPATWQMVHDEIEPYDMSGPKVLRFYVADADQERAFEILEPVVKRAWFEFDKAWTPGCQRTETTQGRVNCMLAAIRGPDRLWIKVFERGETVSYSYTGRGPTAGGPNLTVIRISAAAYY